MTKEMSAKRSFSIRSEWMQPSRGCTARAGLEQRLQQLEESTCGHENGEEKGRTRGEQQQGATNCAAASCSTYQELVCGLLARTSCSISSTIDAGVSCEQRGERRPVTEGLKAGQFTATRGTHRFIDKYGRTSRSRTS